MATQRRTDARRYRTSGNVAYQPEFEQESVREPSRRELVRGNTVRRPEPRRRPHQADKGGHKAPPPGGVQDGEKDEAQNHIQNHIHW